MLSNANYFSCVKFKETQYDENTNEKFSRHEIISVFASCNSATCNTLQFEALHDNCIKFSLLFGVLAGREPCSSIELEENDVSIFNDVGLSLLTVFSCCLYKNLLKYCNLFD